MPPAVAGRAGLNTAPDGTGEFDVDSYMGVVEAYLCLWGLTAPSGLAGFACDAEVTPGVVLLGVHYPGFIINIVPIPAFQLVIDPPLPQAEVLLLATVNFFVTTPTPEYVFLHPLEPQDECLAYWDGDMQRHDAGWVSGDENLPVFGFNSGPIRMDEGSWGAVKNLFR